MKSRASVKGHPLHPMLIVYPFAFLSGAFGFGVAGVIWRKADLHLVAKYLVPTGLAAGVLAAVPGLVDYLNSVPPHSSGKRRAAQHGLLNTAALGLFTSSWVLGRGDHRRTLPLLLQGLGTAALSVAGYMGGTLVYRNQIGVDHRYANAGRWREETLERADGEMLRLAAASLDVNQMKLVHADGARIAVACTDSGYAAFTDRCTHNGGPLSDGTLTCGIVQCPWHGSQFDVHSGAVKSGPATQGIETFPISEPLSGSERRSS